MASKIALLRWGGRRYSLPVEGIRHIVQAPKVFTLPRLQRGLCGVSLFQGELIPMLDMDRLLGDQGNPSAEGGFAVFFACERGLFGFQADRPVQIVDCAAGRLVVSEKDEKGLGRNSFQHREHKYPLVKPEVLMTSLTDSANKATSTETKEA